MQQALRRIAHFISFALSKKGMMELHPLLREIITENNELLVDFIEELKGRLFKPSKYYYCYYFNLPF